MDGSTSKAQVMKPVLLKAGLPFAISVAGFICARLMSRRTILPKESNRIDSSEELRDDESYNRLNSANSVCEEEGQIVTSAHSMISMELVSEYQENLDYEQEVSELRWRVEELQKKEREIRMQFACYRELKEQESVLAKLENMLLLESAYVEFLNREILSMEAENKMLNNMVVEYLKILEQLEHWKSESALLQRKVQKLLKKTKEQSRMIRDKNLRLDAREAESVRNNEELERKAIVIKKLEDEVRDLQAVIDQLQEQKSEVINKLQVVELPNSSISKIEDEGITVEDYKKLVNEYEQLQQDRAAEVKELIFLRWTNACLRHELMRRNQAEKEQDQEKTNIVDIASEGVGDCSIENHLDGLALEHGGEAGLLNVENASNHASSKRQKLLKQFKRWVDGSKKMKSKFDEKEKHDSKCFGRHSAFDEAEEEHLIQASNSCSSA